MSDPPEGTYCHAARGHPLHGPYHDREYGFPLAGDDALFEKHPTARGYLRDRAGYRLMDRREELVGRLLEQVREREANLREGLDYPLAPLHGQGNDEPEDGTE